MDEGTSRRKGKFIPSKQPLSSRYRGFLPNEDTGAPPKKKIASSHVRGRGNTSKRAASEGRGANINQIGSTGHKSSTSGRGFSGIGSSGSNPSARQLSSTRIRGGGFGSVGRGRGFLGQPLLDVYTIRNPTANDSGPRQRSAPAVITAQDHMREEMLEQAFQDGDCPDADYYEEDEDHDVEEDDIAAEAGQDDDIFLGANQDDIPQNDQGEEDHIVGGQDDPGTSSSAIGIAAAAADPSGRKRRPCKAFRGHAQWRKHPKEGLPKQLARHGKHHFYGGSIRTLMTVIYKSYHTRGAIYWSDWSEDDKELCWQKFKEYFFFYDDDSDEVVRDIFIKYGKANWHKWLFYARKAAKNIDKNWLSNPNFPPPPCHKWLLDSEWKDLIAY